MTSFFPHPRGSYDAPAFGDHPYCRRAAWTWLNENACWRETTITVADRTIVLKKGQLCYSYRYLAEVWRWTVPAVQRYIARIRNDTLIDTASDTGRMVITIRNFGQYQRSNAEPQEVADTPRDTATDTQTDTPPDTNKNTVKKEESKKDSFGRSGDERRTVGDGLPGLLTVVTTPQDRQAETAASAAGQPKRKPTGDPAFDAFWARYPARIGNDRKLDARKAFAKALDAGADLEEILRGADGYKAELIRTGKAGTQYVEQAATFLNQEDWRKYAQPAAMPQEPWRTNPKAWTDSQRPPPWPDAPRGQRCGRWFMGTQGWRAA